MSIKFHKTSFLVWIIGNGRATFRGSAAIFVLPFGTYPKAPLEDFDVVGGLFCFPHF